MIASPSNLPTGYYNGMIYFDLLWKGSLGELKFLKVLHWNWSSLLERFALTNYSSNERSRLPLGVHRHSIHYSTFHLSAPTERSNNSHVWKFLQVTYPVICLWNDSKTACVLVITIASFDSLILYSHKSEIISFKGWSHVMWMLIHG